MNSDLFQPPPRNLPDIPEGFLYVGTGPQILRAAGLDEHEFYKLSRRAFAETDRARSEFVRWLFTEHPDDPSSDLRARWSLGGCLYDAHSLYCVLAGSLAHQFLLGFSNHEPATVHEF